MRDVLIVDDEREIAIAIKEYFENFGVTSDYAFDDSFLQTKERYRILLLDINLGRANGFEIVRKIRQTDPQMHIIFISAINEDNEIIKGYGVGADDYIVKPFALNVLLMKVKNILKRENIKQKKKYREFDIDEDSMSLKSMNKLIQLKNQEFRLFMYLYENRGKIVNKEDILQNVFGSGYYTDNNLNVHIKRLRDKLGDKDCTMIKTHWGSGYQLL